MITIPPISQAKTRGSSYSCINQVRLYLMSTMLFGFLICQSQSTISKQTTGQVSKHLITKLTFLRPDKYNTAVQDQSGVYGNNFFKEEILSNSKNDNSYEKTATPTDYFTIHRPGPKMTMCGKVVQYEFHSGYVDNDLNIQIVANPKAPVFETKYTQLKDRDRNAYPWAMIEGEIDINSMYHKYYTPGNAQYRIPKLNQTDVCLYGPWIEEVYDASEDINPNKDHTDVHEVHPAEQFWWIERTQSGYDYILNSAIDASGRFQESGWTHNTMKNIYAIAFDINRKQKSKLVYSIQKISSSNVSSETADGRSHYLIYGRDTLLQVIEPVPDIISIRFEEVGLDPYAITNEGDSVIKGFIVIENTLTNTGNLKLVVNKKTSTPAYTVSASPNLVSIVNKNTITPATGPKRIKVTLKEISTLDNFLGNHNNIAGQQNYFDLTGYIFAEKLGEPSSFSPSTNSILSNRMQMLFPNSAPQNRRVIVHSFNHPKVSRYDNSIVLSLMPGEKVNILADFEAQYQGSFIRTLDLSDNRCYELQTALEELQKNRPLVKELVLENSEENSSNDPKRYKMKIKLEFLLID